MNLTRLPLDLAAIKSDRVSVSNEVHPFVPTCAAIVAAFLSPSIASAVEAVPVSVFEDPAIAKQVVGALVVGFAWIIPYFVLNVIIAPKIGLIEEDPKTELKNKTRDFF